jgi:hypothetical protein
MDRIEWLQPWEAIDEDADRFSAELHREMCPQHCLYGRKVIALGRRKDLDDFLFRVLDGPQPYAIVHLTWSVESKPDFPLTSLCANLDEIRREIRIDHGLMVLRVNQFRRRNRSD